MFEEVPEIKINLAEAEVDACLSPPPVPTPEPRGMEAEPRGTEAEPPGVEAEPQGEEAYPRDVEADTTASDPTTDQEKPDNAALESSMSALSTVDNVRNELTSSVTTQPDPTPLEASLQPAFSPLDPQQQGAPLHHEASLQPSGLPSLTEPSATSSTPPLAAPEQSDPACDNPLNPCDTNIGASVDTKDTEDLGVNPSQLNQNRILDSGRVPPRRRPSILKTVVSIKSDEPVTVVNYEMVEQSMDSLEFIDDGTSSGDSPDRPKSFSEPIVRVDRPLLADADDDLSPDSDLQIVEANAKPAGFGENETSTDREPVQLAATNPTLVPQPGTNLINQHTTHTNGEL